MEKMYFLALVPPPEVSKIFQSIILNLSKKYKCPVFEPHITLLGHISSDLKTVKQNAKLLVSKLEQFPVSFSEVSFSSTYYQSVFFRVKSTARLMNANILAKEIYGVENKVFMPHLSLIYGNQSMEEREKISSEIEIPKKVSFNVSKLVIVRDGESSKDWVHEAEFEIK